MSDGRSENAYRVEFTTDTGQLTNLTVWADTREGARENIERVFAADPEVFGEWTYELPGEESPAPQHVDYPHEPGTLYDCAACDMPD